MISKLSPYSYAYPKPEHPEKRQTKKKRKETERWRDEELNEFVILIFIP